MSRLSARAAAEARVQSAFGRVAHIPLVAVGLFLGFAASTTHNLRHKKRFPIPVVAANRRVFVLADLLIDHLERELLEAGYPPAETTPLPASSSPVTEQPRRPRGRPRKLAASAGEGAQ